MKNEHGLDESLHPTPVSPMRRWLRVYAISLAAWAVVGAMYIGRDVVRKLYWGIPEPWEELWFWSVRVIVSASLTLAVLWLGRRWPIERGTWVRHISLHVLFGVGFALARAALELAVQIPLDAALGLERNWAQSFSSLTVAVLLIFGFHEGVLAYWVILSIQAAFRYHEKFQERARQALKLELHAAELRAQVVQAQLGALKMQLQPHFLFNTLNAIVVLVRQQRGLQAEEALTRFSDLLRAVLDDRDAQEVTLDRELVYVRLYLSIEQMRFPDRLQVHVSAEPELLDAAVPHLGLQPLVENAVRHGIARRAAGGRIDVRAFRMRNKLHIAIKNDGTGAVRKDDAHGGYGMGLANLRARLQQLYGNDAELHTEFGEGGETTVTLILPFRHLAPIDKETLVLGEFAGERVE
jgi:two-component system, LytTR family, sensor kinase